MRCTNHILTPICRCGENAVCPHCGDGRGSVPCRCSRESVPRVAGLSEGKIWTTPDFDEPMELLTRAEIRAMVQEELATYADRWRELAKY